MSSDVLQMFGKVARPELLLRMEMDYWCVVQDILRYFVGILDMRYSTVRVRGREEQPENTDLHLSCKGFFISCSRSFEFKRCPPGAA